MVEGWAIYQCTSCHEIVCFRGSHLQDLSGFGSIALSVSGQEAQEILPALVDDFSDWPSRARRYMEQAVQALGAPDGSVMLAGSAVDAMLKEKGLVKGSVYDRIKQAVEENLLTEAMGEWAHAVRLAANNPRHADIDDPHATADEARAVIEFAKALGQFLFVLPARIQRGKEAAEKAKETAQGETA